MSETGTRQTARRSAGIVGLAVMGSRVLGLVRELTFAAMFGGGKLLDSYLGAFQIPNLLRDLFAEGALSTAFTTTFSKTWEKDGEPAAWEVAHLVFSALTLVLGVICILGIVAAPVIVNMTNYGFHEVPGKFELTVSLTRLLFPFILFVSLAAAVMGVLNSRNIFGIPASASSAFNLVSVVTGVALACLFDPQINWMKPHFGEKALYGVCLGVLLGGLAQLAIQLPTLWKVGYRFRWHLNFSDPRLRVVMMLMIPSVIAGAAVQVNVMVNGLFASHIDGGRSWLNCAFRLMQFPIGVFGVAIATVTLPAVSVHHARNNLAAFGATVKDALRLAFFLTLPAAVGLAVLAETLIRVIYQHGRFSAHDTAQTAAALQAYVIGLAGYAAIKVITPCFYALDQPRTPLRVSLFGIILNVILNSALVLGFGMGHIGLALTTGLIALINFGQLLWALAKMVDLGEPGDWWFFFARVGLATAVCGETAYAIDSLSAHWTLGRLFPSVIALGFTTGLAAAIYFGLAAAMNLPEADMITRIVKKRLGKK